MFLSNSALAMGLVIPTVLGNGSGTVKFGDLSRFHLGILGPFCVWAVENVFRIGGEVHEQL